MSLRLSALAFTFLAAHALHADPITPGTFVWDGDTDFFTTPDSYYDDPNGMLVTQQTYFEAFYGYSYQASREFTVLTAGYFTQTDTLSIQGFGLTWTPSPYGEPSGGTDPYAYGYGLLTWTDDNGLNGNETIPANSNYYAEVDFNQSVSATEYLTPGDYTIAQTFYLNTSLYDSSIQSSFQTTLIPGAPVPEPRLITGLIGLALLAGCIIKRARFS